MAKKYIYTGVVAFVVGWIIIYLFLMSIDIKDYNSLYLIFDWSMSHLGESFLSVVTFYAFIATCLALASLWALMALKRRRDSDSLS